MQSISAACTVCPQWTSIPACSCSAYTSFVNKYSALAFVVVDFSLLFFPFFLCFYDLHTVRLTEFQPLWVSAVRIAGNVVQAKCKNGTLSLQILLKLQLHLVLPVSFSLAGCGVVFEIQYSLKSKNIYMHKMRNIHSISRHLTLSLQDL